MILEGIAAMQRNMDFSYFIPSDSCDDVIATYNAVKQLTKGGRDIYCNESGTTLRLLLPIAAAMGASVTFHMEKGLYARPMSKLIDELKGHGVMIIKTEREEEGTYSISGQLISGEFNLPGDISSQYISGLLMALPLLKGDSTVKISGEISSYPYVQMTLSSLENSGVTIVENHTKGDEGTKLIHDLTYVVKGGQTYSHDNGRIEPDMSAAAYWITAGYISKKSQLIFGEDLNRIIKGEDKTLQGDAKIDWFLRQMFIDETALVTLNMDATPDLTPALAVAAAARMGRTQFRGVQRLKYKESNRIESIMNLINGLGGEAVYTEGATEDEDVLTVVGCGGLKGGTVNPYGDHRIAMAAAIAALICSESVTISRPECVNKSYPGFFDEFYRLAHTNL